MRWTILLLSIAGCAAKPPPPQVCDPPKPEPKKFAVGFCPISYSDASVSDADTPHDSGYDAPR